MLPGFIFPKIPRGVRGAEPPFRKGAADVTEDPLSLAFAALADPTRRSILALLLEDDMAVTDVAEPFAMSLAAISKHLQILAEAGLISQEKRGRVKWCKLEPDGLRGASVWMQGFGQFEPVDLDGFERFLMAELAEDAAGVATPAPPPQGGDAPPWETPESA